MPVIPKKAAADPAVFKTPDLSPAQMIGLVPIIATLGSALGIYHLSPDQTSAIHDADIAVLGLFAGDAIIRHGRAVGNASKK